MNYTSTRCGIAGSAYVCKVSSAVVVDITLVHNSAEVKNVRGHCYVCNVYDSLALKRKCESAVFAVKVRAVAVNSLEVHYSYNPTVCLCSCNIMCDDLRCAVIIPCELKASVTYRTVFDYNKSSKLDISLYRRNYGVDLAACLQSGKYHSVLNTDNACLCYKRSIKEGYALLDLTGCSKLRVANRALICICSVLAVNGSYRFSASNVVADRYGNVLIVFVSCSILNVIAKSSRINRSKLTDNLRKIVGVLCDIFSVVSGNYAVPHAVRLCLFNVTRIFTGKHFSYERNRGNTALAGTKNPCFAVVYRIIYCISNDGILAVTRHSNTDIAYYNVKLRSCRNNDLCIVNRVKSYRSVSLVSSDRSLVCCLLKVDNKHLNGSLTLVCFLTAIVAVLLLTGSSYSRNPVCSKAVSCLRLTFSLFKTDILHGFPSRIGLSLGLGLSLSLGLGLSLGISLDLRFGFLSLGLSRRSLRFRRSRFFLCLGLCLRPGLKSGLALSLGIGINRSRVITCGKYTKHHNNRKQ